MKHLRIIACLAAFVTSTAANAATVDTIDMGNVSVGLNGYFSNGSIPHDMPASEFGPYNGAIIGILPANSQITFSYSFYGTLFLNAKLSSYGSYSGINGETKYIGYSSTDSNGATSSLAYTQPAGGGAVSNADALVLTTANLTPGTLFPDISSASGTSVITNTAAIPAAFSSQLIGFLAAGGFNINYAVTALSAVPLPAAAYLFGSGLLALAGMSRMKKKQAA